MTPDSKGSRLVLLGAGGHGKVAADTARMIGWEDIVFLDAAYPARRANGNWPIIGAMDDLDALRAEDVSFFISVGANGARARLADQIGGPLVSLIHPAACVSQSASIGEGTLVVAGAIVNGDAQVGRGVILNTGCTVDHDCRIGDFAHISPGANLAGAVS